MIVKMNLDYQQKLFYHPSMDNPDLPALARGAIDGAGGTTVVAQALGYTRQRVHYWRRAGVPAKEVPIVHRALGISPMEIRPDLYDQAILTPSPIGQ